MFKFIKSILGIGQAAGNAEEKPIKKSVDAEKNRSYKSDKKRRPADKAGKTDKYGRGTEKKSKKPEKKKSEKRAESPVNKIEPPELMEIPVAEGKRRFCDYDLDKSILLGLQYIKFMYCTHIQELALPQLLEGKDIAGKAQTGTGKTAAFLICAFNYLLKHPLENQRPGVPRCVVLSPTRELAIQIHKDAENIGIFTGLNSVVVFGGMDHNKQRMDVEEKVDILIGTPGRIIDYSRSGSLNLHQVEILIIDEADRMLDMGFIPDVRRIISQMPDKSDRQTMLFSATLDDSVLRLASDWLVNPILLESEPDKLVGESINQTFYTVSGDEKLALLLYFINNKTYERMLIFGNRKDVNLRLQRNLERYGIKVELLSGDVAQEKRIKILERFRSGKDKILIATDVAARGIHVDNVSLVINYDLPERPDDYVHRIGRTGRAGKSGESISFLCEYGAYNLDGIEKLLKTTFKSILPEELMLQLPKRVNGGGDFSGNNYKRKYKD